MKFPSVMLALFFITACSVKVTPPGGEATKPGTERTFSPQTVEQGSLLKSQMKNLCDALEEKELSLRDYEAERARLNTTYVETDCDGKSSAKTNHDVMVVRDGGTFVFQNEGRNFPLPEVETTDSGVMKEICNNLQTLQNPMLAGAGASSAIEFEIKNGIADCPNNSQNTCLLVMKGRISEMGGSYVVSESTLISFETVRGGRIGFFTYKNVLSYGTCSGNKYRTKTVRFN